MFDKNNIIFIENPITKKCYYFSKMFINGDFKRIIVHSFVNLKGKKKKSYNTKKCAHDRI